MKRSKTISWHHLKQTADHFKLKPMSIAVASIGLYACSTSRDAVIYNSLEQCINEKPNQVNLCKTAYQTAQQTALDNAPRYASKRDCEHEFGYNNCHQHHSGNHNTWFIPAMAGFVLGSARSAYAPVYTSYAYHSPYYGLWTAGNGVVYGRQNTRKVRVSDRAFQQKPAITKTISRGGFGSTAAMKSGWGNAYRSGWGG